MNKEEILAKSRKENKNQDEYEKYVLSRAGHIAMAVGGVLCMLIILFEAIFTDSPALTPWAIYLTMTGTTLLIKYHYLRKKHDLVFGLLQLAFATAMLILHIIKIMGW